MTGPIDEIERTRSKGSIRDGDYLDSNLPKQGPKNEIKDTMSSAKVPTAPAQDGFSASKIIDWGTWMWAFFSTPLVSNASTGTSGKPGGDAITPIGSPSLEPPFQIDKKMFDKCIKELQELLKKITGILNEVGDELQENEQMIMRWLIDYLKKQKMIREEGASDMKADIVRGSKNAQDAHRELVNIGKLNSDSEKDRRFWEKVNSTVFWMSAAVTVTLVAGTIFATSGAGGAAMITSVGKITLGLTSCMLGIAQGVTQLMKANLTRKTAEFKEKEIKLNEHIEATHFNVKMKMDLMHEWASKSLTISGWMTKVLEKDRQTSLEMISISPPTAPVA